MTKSANKRVVAALSGGVDSSVAAALLKEQGYEVIGLTLQLYDCEDGQSERSCCGLSGVSDARAAAGALGIPHYVLNGQDLFERRVLRYAWQEYDAGRTPNPCVRCNEWMKFGLLYEQARKLGADYVATGHHARIARNGSIQLLRGKDPGKDQSYFLFSLTPEQLAMSLLPIGDLSKSEVRELARQNGLPNADRLESQDACIAQRGDLAEALRRRFSGQSKPGVIKDADGKVVGRHEGVHRVTIGQRKGLGLAMGERRYVTHIDAASGTVTLGDKEQLETEGLRAAEVSWLAEVAPEQTIDAEVQIRYRHRAVPARVKRVSEHSAEVQFAQPQSAVAPGQAVVFYQGERVLGGGWIERQTANHA